MEQLWWVLGIVTGGAFLLVLIVWLLLTYVTGRLDAHEYEECEYSKDELMDEEPLERIIIMRPVMGISRMQVCTTEDATNEEILAYVNKHNPAGTTSGWLHVIRNEDPVYCEEHDERVHLIIEC